MRIRVPFIVAPSTSRLPADRQIETTRSGGGNGPRHVGNFLLWASSCCALLVLLAGCNSQTGTNVPYFSYVPGSITVPAVDQNGTPASDPTIAAFLASATVNDLTYGTRTSSNDAPAIFPIGSTLVTFFFNDSGGHRFSETRTVTVVLDTTPPVITRLGFNPANVTQGTAYSDAGATALDDLDGDITNRIVKGGLPVNTAVLGAHTVTYDVSDASGNAAAQVTRTVNVVGADTVPPVITRLGSSPVNVTRGTAYGDAGATALDDVDGNVTARIVTVNPVNTAAPGTYTVTYDVSDAAGNPAVQVTRTVNVTAGPDVTPPVITRLGSSPVNVTRGTAYVDAGATALDDVDGNVTARIVTVNPVNTAAPGTYTVAYDVSDAAGNPAVQVTRTVVVLAAAGVVWTPRLSGTGNSLNGVTWSGTQFVAVGGVNGAGTILTSPDGVSWTARGSGIASPLNGVSWSGSKFVAVGYAGKALTSPDGVTWTQQVSGTANMLTGVAWSGGKFVAVGMFGTILTSPDGVTWTTQVSGTTLMLAGVAWNGGMFVAVGQFGMVLTSSDGFGWTPQGAGVTSNSLYGVTWSGTQLATVGDTGTILTSPDGVAWTAQTSVGSNYYGIAWDGAQFVVVGIAGAIQTSPDGVTWTPRTSGTVNGLQGVCWGNARFVAVGTAGTILTSP
jgi:hypothetical protein